jgi:hypothetical protein
MDAEQVIFAFFASYKKYVPLGKRKSSPFVDSGPSLIAY